MLRIVWYIHFKLSRNHLAHISVVLCRFFPCSLEVCFQVVLLWSGSLAEWTRNSRAQFVYSNQQPYTKCHFFHLLLLCGYHPSHSLIYGSLDHWIIFFWSQTLFAQLILAGVVKWQTQNGYSVFLHHTP